ncbi:polysaccharide biosynthesis C-terminal domain-containing protein [uncultured Dokdonia sp.]|uniref:lipopolysaccharide biosynthesis protein n=1 Tax=uncultured Dokdonia sp. TaxID=575653 RepID=UPI002607B351|nr:polysaccharide biosynthesis C-terminal domain-containing protein [uncultured Dokdonia sp.]
MSTLKNLFKHTFVYGLATVLPRVLTVLLTWLLTKYLDTESDFGEVSILFTYIVLLNVLLTYGMETAFFRFYNGESATDKTVKTSLWALALTTLVFAVTSIFWIEPVARLSDIDVSYWRWVIGILSFDTLMVIPFALMRAKNQSMKYAVIKMISVVISVGTSAVFLIATQKMTSIFTWLPNDKKELFFISGCMASALTLLFVSKPYISKIYIDISLLKRMLRYSWPILIAGLAFAINEALDKVLLQWLLPLNEQEAKEQVGIYTACYRLAIGMTLYATAFRLGVEPFFFSQSKDKDASQQYAMITKAFVVLGAIGMFVYIVLLDVIKPLLIGKPSYLVGMKITPIVVFAFFFFGIYQTLSVWYKVTDKTRYGAYISISGAALTIVLNVVCIPTIGYTASAIATCAAYGLMMIVSYSIGRKHMPIPYDLKNIVLYIILSVGFSSVFFYLLRDYFGIGSIQLYLAGILMTVVLVGVIWYREQPLLQRILRRKNES